MVTERRGGKRAGTPGRSYPNRKDMRTTQAPTAATGQTYGEAGAQINAQKVVPLSRVPGPSAAGAGPSPGAMAGMPGGGGVEIPSLSAPTTRPNEPLTAGLSTGPGPGPEALNLPQQMSGDQSMLGQVQALYKAYPNDDIARLITELQTRIDTSQPRRSRNIGIGQAMNGLMQSGGFPQSGMGANAGMTDQAAGLGPNNAGVAG